MIFTNRLKIEITFNFFCKLVIFSFDFIYARVIYLYSIILSYFSYGSTIPSTIFWLFAILNNLLIFSGSIPQLFSTMFMQCSLKILASLQSSLIILSPSIRTCSHYHNLKLVRYCFINFQKFLVVLIPFSVIVFKMNFYKFSPQGNSFIPFFLSFAFFLAWLIPVFFS